MSNFDLCFVFNLNPTQPNPIQSKLKCIISCQNTGVMAIEL